MRGLGTTPEFLPPTLAILDHRLAAGSTAPIAVGLSGGSDSVALALIASVWAKCHNRALHVLTVDHQLNPDSAGWSQNCAAFAARLGVTHHNLNWDGPKPTTGLPAAARQARHRLLAVRAREIGAKVILLGHTADDRAEGHLMRQTGSTTPDPREWAPSPIWPEGRGIFVLRPLLDLRRGELRQWLTSRGETWIEDPANENPKFARARARATLDPLTWVAPTLSDDGALAGLAAEAGFNPILALPRASLRQVNLQTIRALTGIACLCVSGGSRPPRTEPLDRLVDRLLGDDDVVATLAGARVEADMVQVRFMRNPGELARRRVGPMPLRAGLATVWDGRYVLTTEMPAEVVALQGHMTELSKAARKPLKALPVAARGALPLVHAGNAFCPILEDVSGFKITYLIPDRFRAATGLVTFEPN